MITSTKPGQGDRNRLETLHPFQAEEQIFNLQPPRPFARVLQLDAAGRCPIFNLKHPATHSLVHLALSHDEIFDNCNS